MAKAIIFDKDAALRQGIAKASSAFGKALQQQQQRDRQQGALNAVLEWSQSIPPDGDMMGNLGTLQKVMEDKNIDPSVIQPIVQNVIQQSAQQRMKKPELTPFQKEMQQDRAKLLSETLRDIPKITESRKNIDRMRELSKGLKGLTGYGKAAIGSEEATEFNALGLTAIEPVLKVLNPRGVIPQRKIEMIRDLYSPKASDNRWTIEGKIKALESFTENAEKLGEVMSGLYRMYGENIPMQALTEYETLASSLIDNSLSKRGAADVNRDGQPDKMVMKRPTADVARNNKGRVIVNQETGEKLISNGSRWVKYEGK
jgi:hypothetical protein